jgi:cytochrome c oxidase subunit 2
MSILFTIAVIALIFIVIFQIAKASEYVTLLRGEQKGLRQSNKINAWLMIVFLVLGLLGVWYCNDVYFGQTLLAQESASVEGERVDSMMWLTIAVTGIVLRRLFCSTSLTSTSKMITTKYFSSRTIPSWKLSGQSFLHWY